MELGADRVGQGDVEALDEFLFEPTSWDIAMSIDLDLELDDFRPQLDELADAMLVWLEEPALERVSAHALEAVWSPDLERSIREGLEELARSEDSCSSSAPAALADLDRRGRASDIAHSVAQRLAMHLGQEDQPPDLCLCCVDEWLSAAPPGQKRELVLDVARLARRDAGVPAGEVRDALVKCSVDSRGREPAAAFARAVATDERRAAAHARLDRVCRLSRTSLPALSQALTEVLNEEPAVDPADDAIWVRTCSALVGGLEAARN